jgi:hypothetical protein
MSTFITKLAKDLKIQKVDAKKPLAISVKPCDVKSSTTKSVGNCAFARAAKRSLGCSAAYFFRSCAWLQFPNRLERYTLPVSAQKEIVAFDRAKAFEPGEYQLNAPAKSQTMAAAMKRSKKRPGRHQPADGKIKRRFVHRTENVRGLSE